VFNLGTTGVMNNNIKNNLHAALGRAFSLAVVLGSTIGVGILRMPGEIAAQFKDYRLVLVLWAAGGIYSFLGALSFAELATRFPKAGGPYVYVKHAFGERFGFAMGWADWLSFCSVLALLITVITDYLGILIPALAVHAKIAASIILLLFVLLNWFGIQTSNTIQQVASFVKVVVLAALVAGCLFIGRIGLLAVGPLPHASLVLSLTIATQMVLGTYAGWHAAVYFAEENQDPKRSIPNALLGGVAIITVVYLLINVAVMRVVPPERLAGSELPVADAATSLIGPFSGAAILLICIWSLVSVVNVYLLSSTRILFSLSRDHQWSSFSALSKNGTPIHALLGNSAVALVLLLTRSFEKLVALASFILLIVYCSCFVAHLVLRRRQPFIQNCFQAWGYPFTTVTALLISLVVLAMMVVEDPWNSIFSTLLLLGTYACYRWVIARVPDLLNTKTATAKRLAPASLTGAGIHTQMPDTKSLLTVGERSKL
jgi:APA family basic amino acid/polyamine antiporter